MQAHREALQAVTQAQGLLLEMEFSKAELHQIGEWDYPDDTILELKMEDLVRLPYDGFLRVFGNLGLLSTEEPTKAVDQILSWAARLRIERAPGVDSPG